MCGGVAGGAGPGARGSAGFTIVELMVAMVAASLLVTLAFAVTQQVVSTTQAQANVSDEMQTLRVASELIAEDVRNAGYMSAQISVAASALPSGILTPVSITEGADATATDANPSADEIRIAAANDGNDVLIDKNGGGFAPGAQQVTSIAGFSPNSLVVLYNANAAHDCTGTGAQACMLYITGVHGPASGVQGHLDTPVVSPWNTPANTQCNNLGPCFTDGATQVIQLSLHAYRIAPPAAQPEGMLQLSKTGGTANDWVDLAPGFVDLQLALCLDTNGNGLCDASEWVNNVPSLMASPTAGQLVAVRITLVARTVFPSQGWTLGAEPTAEDHSVTFTAGSANTTYMYRSFTQVVELRNGPI